MSALLGNKAREYLQRQVNITEFYARRCKEFGHQRYENPIWWENEEEPSKSFYLVHCVDCHSSLHYSNDKGMIIVAGLERAVKEYNERHSGEFKDDKFYY